MVLPQAMAWVQYWFRVLSLKFCRKSKKICGDISQLSPAFCMYAVGLAILSHTQNCHPQDWQPVGNSEAGHLMSWQGYILIKLESKEIVQKLLFCDAWDAGAHCKVVGSSSRRLLVQLFLILELWWIVAKEGKVKQKKHKYITFNIIHTTCQETVWN